MTTMECISLVYCTLLCLAMVCSTLLAYTKFILYDVLHILLPCAILYSALLYLTLLYSALLYSTLLCVLHIALPNTTILHYLCSPTIKEWKAQLVLVSQ